MGAFAVVMARVLLSLLVFGSVASADANYRFIEGACDQHTVSAINASFNEAKWLADAMGVNDENYNFSIPYSQWLGDQWNQGASPHSKRSDPSNPAGGLQLYTRNYSQIIHENIDRLGRFFGNIPEDQDDVYFYCKDHSTTCSDHKGLYAYSWTMRSQQRSHHTVLCPDFFKQPSLSWELQNAGQDKPESVASRELMEYFETNGASIIFHQLWYFPDLITNPECADEATGAIATWNLARTEQTEHAMRNADSYTKAAIAIFIQKHFKLKIPPVPSSVLPTYDKDAAKFIPKLIPHPESTDSGKRYLKLGEEPSGWSGPSLTDPKNWIAMGNVDTKAPPVPPSPSSSTHTQAANQGLPTLPPSQPTLPPQLKCAGAHSPTFWMLRGHMNDAIEKYCSEAGKQGLLDPGSGAIARTYNKGTFDEVDISIGWQPGARFKATADKCNRAMKSIMDNCDGNDDLNNPFNLKHGGEMVVGPATYTVTPKSLRYTSGHNCKVHLKWKIEYDLFTVNGPGTSRKYWHYFYVIVWDSAGMPVYQTPGLLSSDKALIEVTTDKAYKVESLLQEMIIIPEAKPILYTRFTFGSQSFTTHDKVCKKVENWDSAYSPARAHWECPFTC